LTALCTTLVVEAAEPTAPQKLESRDLKTPGLESAARQALREAAQLRGVPDAVAVERLTDLYRQVVADDRLPPARRETLRLAIRSRLQRWSTALHAQQSLQPSVVKDLPDRSQAVPGSAVKETASVKPVGTKSPTVKKAREITNPILAQQLPAGQAGLPAGQGVAQPADYGPELVELIEDTIAPASWDKLGGSGVIRFWAPGHALVVRQNGDVHEDLARLLKDLGL
jgi:hypothetical protein